MARQVTLSSLFTPPAAPGEIIGVRVAMRVKAPGQGSKYDKPVNINSSITVNATATTTLVELMQAAAAFVRAGNLGRRGGRPIRGIILDAEVAAVYYGGFSDPALTIG